MALHLLYCVGLTTGQLVPKGSSGSVWAKKSASLINYHSAATSHSQEMRWCIILKTHTLSLSVDVGSFTRDFCVFVDVAEIQP